MASLGNLFFSILYKDDPKQLEEIKKKALEQLKDIEVNLKISGTTSMDDVRAEINKIIAERKELNLGVDKTQLVKEVEEGLSGGSSSPEIKEDIQAYSNLKDAIENVTGARSENIRSLIRLKAELSSVQEQIKVLNRSAKEGDGLSVKETEKLNSRISREFELKEAISQRSQLIKADVKDTQANVESMEQMAQTLARLRTAYKKLDSEERTSPFGTQLQSEIQKLDSELKGLDANIGNFQRNVGNYASAFDAFKTSTGSIDEMSASLLRMRQAYMAMSAEERSAPIGAKMQADIQAADAELRKLEKRMKSSAGSVSGFNKMQWETNQLLRELPALAYGPNIFFGAISNNLPMFFDGLKKAREEYREFIALQKQGITTGKAVQPVWKQLAATLISWQTIMIVAITVLTKYGREIIDFARNVSSAVKAQRELTKSLKEAKGEYADATKELTEMQALFKNVDGTFVTSKEVLDKYNESLGKVFGEATNVGEAEQLLIDNTPAYLKAMIQKMKANAVLAEMQKESGKAASLRLKAEEKEITFWNKVSESFKAASRGEVARAKRGESGEDFVRKQWNAAADVAEEKAEDMGKTYLEIMEKYYKDAADNGLDLFQVKTIRIKKRIKP